MNKRRNILFLIAIFVLLLIKPAHAQGDAHNAGVDWNQAQDIQGTWHSVVVAGLWFGLIAGGLLTALRIRATRALEESGQGGPQQLGLTQIPAKRAEDPR